MRSTARTTARTVAAGVTAISCTLPNVSAGDLITVEGTDQNGYATSFSDNENGAYTGIYYASDFADPNYSGMAYFMNSASGSLTVQMTLSASDPWAIISVQAWKGAATTSVLDTSAITQNQTSTSGTVANATCGSPQSPAEAGELIIGYLVPDTDFSVTPGTNYTLIDTFDTSTLPGTNPAFPEYWTQSTASATNAPFGSAADDWTEGCAAFKPAQTVTQANPGIGWSTPAPIVYGMPLSALQLNATANVPGTFSYTPSSGTILEIGQQTLSVTFTPLDQSKYTIASANVSLTVVAPGPGELSVYLSPPGAQATTVAGAVTETFDNLSPGIYTSAYVSPVGIGTYIGSPTNPFAILSPSTFGGATDSSHTDPTNYLAIGNASQSNAPIVLNLSQPAAYFGLWFSAGDHYNGAAFYSGNTLLGSFNTADLLTLLNNGVGAITSGDGSTYQTIDYFGNPNRSPDEGNDTAEPFAYVSFVPSGATIDKVIFFNSTATQSAFESDNHSVIVAGNPVSIPGTYVPVPSSSSPPVVVVTVSPANTTLSNGGQQQQFTATVTNASNTAVTWSLSPAGVGTINTSGVYTAPGTIATQQTLTITATSQADSTKSASATVTLLPSILVAVTPAASTLYGGQTQQFTASVSNTSNTAVTWSLSPAGVGTVDASGLYSAPASISAQQTVQVTATSQADMTRATSSTVTLLPTQCASNGFSHERSIVIDHTKIPNTDQIDFPIVVSGTYSFLATAANGGEIQSQNGYDIIFTSDPGGQNRLDFEIDSYNPITGAAAFWIRIPVLSHSTDTTVYMWYGSPSITVSQENKAGVWKNNYLSVYHLGDGTAVGMTDSGSAGYTLAGSASAAPGVISGAASFNGSGSSYLYHDSVAAYPSGTSPVTLETWVQRAPGFTSGEMLGYGANSYNGSRVALWESSPTDIALEFENQAIDGFIQPDNNWHHVVGVYGGGAVNSTTDQLYVDGVPVAVHSSGGTPSITTSEFKIGGIPTVTRCCSLNGSVDEVRISSLVRSADWIATEYNNQSSPSIFYALSPENAVVISPGSARLLPSQGQQFTSANCGTAVNWSISPAGLGAISATGFYTAPSNISVPQTVTVTATSQADTTKTGTAIGNLLPLTPPLTLTAVTQPPYATGTSQGFVVTAAYANGEPVAGATVTFSVAGSNSFAGSATSNANGIVTFTYLGSNSGTDSVTSSAVINGTTVASNTLSVSWVPGVATTAEGSITLLDQPQIGLEGLVGAFTDSTGSVIQPLAIGAKPRVFVVPPGATQLQLGVEDDYYSDNFGPGFVVAIDDVSVTVPAGAQPWLWIAGGLNFHYMFGVQNGTDPVIAATHLTPGQSVTVAYQSGFASPGGFYSAIYNADGVPSVIPGTMIGSTGTHAPTYYMSAASYPVGQPVSINAVVKDGSGAPMVNVPVTLEITGGNARQLETVTDSTGTAVFTYAGLVAGLDILRAEAVPSGGTTFVSSQVTITWVASTNLPSGLLALTPSTLQPLSAGGRQAFNIFATDSFDSPVAGLKVGLLVSGVDQFLLQGTTDSTGHATITYQDLNSGIASVKAVATINNLVTYSNVVSVPWTLPPATASGNGNNGTLSVAISGESTITLPNTLLLNATVSDSALPSGGTIQVNWSAISGPAPVTFASPQQPATVASFTQPGAYTLQLSASDSTGNAAAQIQVTVNPVPGTTQGWIGSPAYGATVSGVVPITVATGTTLQSGVLTYYPANSTNSAITLNADTTGSGQIGTLDTTLLTNGSYWIQLKATDINGNFEYSLILVTVAGSYKPGRVTASVTDLVVPATGLAINIQRQYDSINAGTVGDFGYGWTLGTTVNLAVDPKGNVTFTLSGQRKTFYLAPQLVSLFGFYSPAFTPEPGFHGTLTDSAPGCSSLFDFLIPDGSVWDCVGGGQYNPPGYIYTDPSGTSYTISANGSLQSIVDRNGNATTINSAGITSSTGLSVPFLRDASGRITQITDPQGNKYLYTYDGNGNLDSVTYPGIGQPSTYTYDASHRYSGGTDARGNVLPTTQYYPDGRLESVTDALNQTTGYAYDLTKNTTTITYPPDASGNVATATMAYDSYGMLLSSTDPLGHTTTNVYDTNHNLTSVTDPLGNKTIYTYDSNGNQTSVTYPQTATSSSTTTSTAYNQYSEPTSTTDELGNARAFTYDANFNPQGVTDASGTLASFVFNANGTLQSGAIGYDISSQPGKAGQFAYDAHGNLAGRTDALGHTTSYTYDSLGRKVSMTIPLPNSGTSAAAATTTYQYDALGNPTQTAAPLGRTTSSQYDANGNKISDTDALGRMTTYQYDALNRLTTTTYPTQPVTTTTRTYDFRNNVIDETDQGGHVTHHVYDLADRLTSVTKGYGTSNAATTSYSYDDAGRKVSETDPLGHTTEYAYDAAGNLTAVSGVNGNFQYTYDNARNRIGATDGNGNTTQYRYDARKRLVTTTYPDSTTTTNAYDGPGNLLSVTDQAGNVVRYTYDAANQLKSVIQVNSPNTGNNTTAYGYDPDGNLTSLTDANGHTTSNVFDLLYQLSSKTLPDGSSTESRSYDTAGNLLSLKHFNGDTTTYTYDGLNRLLTRVPDSNSGEPTVTFTYTPTGKRATMADASGTTTYTYDSLDRLTTKATPEGTLNYTYDAAGNLASMSSSDGNVSIAYTWDELNRLSTVVDNRLTGSNTTTYTYDSANNLATATYPNGIHSTFSYDTLNRLTGQASSLGGYSYQLGPTGNRTSASEQNGRSVTWNFDGIYRLAGETISSDPSNIDGTVAYGLDPVGNRLSANSTLSGVSSGTFSFNGDDLMGGESYDANGNVTSTGGKNFTYDSENHLKSKNGGAVTLIYDGDGNRVAKTVNGVTTRYLVDDLNPTGYPQVVEESVNGSVQRAYSYGLQRIDVIQLVSNAWTLSFYGYDGFGNVRQLTNSSGAITDSYDYDAFGNLLNKTGSTPNNYLYRAEQYDSDLGLYYLRARYYNPLTGRFLSRDPEDGEISDPATLHKYNYASADPVNRLDPSGRADEEEDDVITLTIAANPVVIEGEREFEAAVACVLIWEGSATVANVVAGPYGTVQMVAPCLVVGRRDGRTRPVPIPFPIGKCMEFVDANCQPGDKEIIYTTIHPVANCGAFGLSIFQEPSGAQIGITRHAGLLNNGIVYDNIYPGGIPESEWVGGAYTVPLDCSLGSTAIGSFNSAVARGIGIIQIE